MSKRTPILSAILLASVLPAVAAQKAATLVICAPAYPGTTKEAQPNMDALAAAAANAADWPPASLTAEYYETEDGGLARVKSEAPSLAIVPLPFYLVHAGELKLTPRAQAVAKDGRPTETWSLVAKKGRVSSPSSLAGFNLASLAAYAPDFIRNVALAHWGELPADVTFVATGQVLSSLRRSASGEPIAVLLDGSQAASLATLPFASELEVVAMSPPVPAIVVCSVGAGPGTAATRELVAGLLKMHESATGASALSAVRLAKFVALDAKGISAARAAYRTRAKTAAR